MAEDIERQILLIREETKRNAKLIALVDIYLDIVELEDDNNEDKISMKNSILDLIARKESELVWVAHIH